MNQMYLFGEVEPLVYFESLNESDSLTLSELLSDVDTLNDDESLALAPNRSSIVSHSMNLTLADTF